MRIKLDLDSIDSYRLFLRIKSLPSYRFVGREAWIPDEYASRLGIGSDGTSLHAAYRPSSFLFDYQAGTSELAIRKKKFAIFMRPGYGKTLCIHEYVRHVLDVLPPSKAILIVSPLMVIKQTIREAGRFYGDSLPIEQVRAKDLPRWTESGPGRIGITNYEALDDDVPRGRIGALILDECFAAGTIVDCLDSSGNPRDTPIENIVPGDKIINAIGVDVVRSIHRREVPYAVVVKVGEGITCSPNHPFFTQRGWVGAQDLEPGDSISLSRTAMRMVRDSVHPEGCKPRISQVLRDILLSEMADESAGDPGENSQPGGPCQDRSGAFGVAEVGRSQGGCGNGVTSRARTASEQRCDTREDIPPIASHEPQTFRAWGQWEGPDGAATDPDGCSWRRLDSGVCLVVGPTQSRVSDALQTRHRQRQSESLYRGGWALSPFPEGSGREEGRDAGFTRVEGIEVLESGHPGLERYRDANGKLYFYDLEAERHPSFSVNGLLVHNSGMLSSMYGEYGQQCIRLGRGLDYKLALTGTPARNDRIEFANHAVFLDAFPTVNSFLAKFFVNRGQTDNRWELKPHALKPFYKALSHWCIFLSNPATYGYKDNTAPLPPVYTHVHEIGLTSGQSQATRELTGNLLPINPGGITSRAKLSRIAKGRHNGRDIDSLKPRFIKSLVDSWPDESTIIWCLENNEQDTLATMFPDAGDIQGTTKYEVRERVIEDFQAGLRKTIISKTKCIGLGLNLQRCSRMVFSGINDSWEAFVQAVARANRVGSTHPLNVHVPLTELELPMYENVLRKADRIEEDHRIQEELFREAADFS